jgi:hypothetical protein
MAEHILGIDFGTTNSVMAWYDEKAGRPQVISNAEGEEKTPSVVYYAPEGVIVGRGAEMALVDAEFLEEPERGQVLQATFCSVKRDLGKHLLHALPDGRQVSPVEIASEVFKKLKTDAEELFFHEKVRRAVVTHPAAFSPSQRKAIEEAARLGGFEQVTLLEEPVAAALGQMAQGSAVGQGVIVYDLGGGTFDLAYVQRDGTGFRSPLPCLGLPRCGGDDIDQQIYDTLDEKAHGMGMSLYHADGSLSQAALRECRKGKEQLSSLARSGISIMIPEVHSQSKRYFVERGELEGLMGELVESTLKQTLELIRRVEQAGLPLEEVILIGGSTRAPLIAQKLQERLPGSLRLSKTMFADHAVAMGAAATAATVAPAANTIAAATTMAAEAKQPKESPMPTPQPVFAPVVPGRRSGAGGSKADVRYVNEHQLTILGRPADSEDEDDWEMLKESAGVVLLPKGWIFGIRIFVDTDDELTEAVENIVQIKEFIVSSITVWGEVTITDAGLACLEGLTQVTDLDLADCSNITDEGLICLKGFTQLSELDLSGCNYITDETLARLEGLTQLSSLHLSGCNQITDEGLASLEGLTRLSSLDLSYCEKITDRGLASLYRLTQLTSLDLPYCRRITDNGLASLAGLKQLTSLNLSHCYPITDRGLASLAELPQLSSLDLSGCPQITGRGLEQLNKLPITQLNLSTMSQIRDEDLAIIGKFFTLEALNLSDCPKITDSGLSNLLGLSALWGLGLSGCEALTDRCFETLLRLPALSKLNVEKCSNIHTRSIKNAQKSKPELLILH